jgi:hypothetical protein
LLKNTAWMVGQIFCEHSSPFVSPSFWNLL